MVTILGVMSGVMNGGSSPPHAALASSNANSSATDAPFSSMIRFISTFSLVVNASTSAYSCSGASLP